MNDETEAEAPSADRNLNELLDKIADEYDVISERIEFGQLELEVLRVRDPNSVLDEQQILAGHQEVAWQPYWAQAWDAAMSLSRELAAMDFNQIRVMDLGCGLGITGAVMAARGGNVLLGDYAEPALDFAKVNTWPWRDRAEVRKIDWRKDRFEERFEQIVAADILYDRSDIPHLDTFLKFHLTPGGVFLHGDPNRALTNEFFVRFKSLGWSVDLKIIEQVEGQPLRLATFRLV